MTTDAPSPPTCPHCDAAYRAGADQCWLCEAPRDRADSPDAAVSVAALPPHAGFSFSMSSLLLVMTLTAVVVALIAAVPGLGVPLAVLLAPVLVRTAMVVRRRKATGRDVPLLEKVALAGTSLVVSSVILTVVGVASAGSFCGVCLGLAAATNASQQSIGIFVLFSGIVAVGVTAWVWGLCRKWIKRRYQRDIELS